MDLEIDQRISFIKNTLDEAKANGVVVGLSGGKDSAAVAALCVRATKNVIGLIMPCDNVVSDREHALLLANILGIRTIDLNFKTAYDSLVNIIEMGLDDNLNDIAKANIKPRMRMTILYAVAHHMGYLVSGTGNYSEWVMGYFTKWGDGAYDFNPISDLCATEVFNLCKELHVPDIIINKEPSAGLWEGQTDEIEMGVTYSAIDKYLIESTANEEDTKIIKAAFNKSNHKRQAAKKYK